MIQIDKELINSLFDKAVASDRKRMNYDLRTSSNDGSQRMLNALLPGTVVPIHRHPMSNENVICLKGRLVEIVFEEVSGSTGSSTEVPDGFTSTSLSTSSEFQVGGAFEHAMDAQDVMRPRVRLVEKERVVLDSAVGNFGCVVPAGAWHTVEVLEPSVIYEAKDGAYGKDGSTTLTTSSSEAFGMKTISKE